jgi:hypothetical protein
LHRLSAGEQILGVHVDAIGAAVHLAGAELDQVQQHRLEIALGMEITLQAEHGFECVGREFVIVESRGHKTPFV